MGENDVAAATADTIRNRRGDFIGTPLSSFEFIQNDFVKPFGSGTVLDAPDNNTQSRRQR
jgi:hypothetical protein